jgi:hypothetical protein
MNSDNPVVVGLAVSIALSGLLAVICVALAY